MQCVDNPTVVDTSKAVSGRLAPPPDKPHRSSSIEGSVVHRSFVFVKCLMAADAGDTNFDSLQNDFVATQPGLDCSSCMDVADRQINRQRGASRDSKPGGAALEIGLPIGLL